MKKKQVLALMLSAAVVSGNAMTVGAANTTGSIITSESATQGTKLTDPSAATLNDEMTVEEDTKVSTADTSTTEDAKASTADISSSENTNSQKQEASINKATETSNSIQIANLSSSVKPQSDTDERAKDLHYTEMPDGSLVPDEGWMFDEKGNCVPIPDSENSSTEEDSKGDDEKGPVLGIGESFQIHKDQHTMNYKVIEDGRVELYKMEADRFDQSPENMTIDGSVTYKGNTYQVVKVSGFSNAMAWHTKNLTLGEGIEDLNFNFYGLRLDSLNLPASLTHIIRQETYTDDNGDICITPMYYEQTGQCIKRFTLAEGNKVYKLEDGNIRLLSEANQDISVGSELVKDNVHYIVKENNELECISASGSGDNGTLTIPGSVHIKGRDFKVKSIAQSFEIPLDSVKHLIIGEGIETFDASNSNHNYGLESLSLPASLKEYKSFVAKDLKRIDVGAGNENYTSEDGILYNKDMSTLITLPAAVDMAEYETPSAVKRIDANAIGYTKKIKKLIISDQVETMGASSIFCTESIEELVIGSGIKTFEQSAVSDCSGVKKLTIKASCRYSNWCFYNFPDVEDIYIEGSPTSFGAYVFTKMPSLKAYHVSNSTTLCSKNGILYGYDKGGGKVLSKYPANKGGKEFILPDDVTRVEVMGFNRSQNLEKLIIPKGVQLDAGMIYEPAHNLEVYITDSSLKTNSSSAVFVPGTGSVIVCVNNQNFADELNGSGYLYNDSESAKAEAVVKTIPATSLKLDKKSVEMTEGSSTQVKASWEPYYSTDQMTWETSNKDVATVDQDGNIKAVGHGNAIVSVKMGSKTEKVNVTVTAPLKSISLDKTVLNLNKGDKDKLNVSYNPDYTTDSKKVTWVSSDKKVVIVDENGNVTAVGAGDTTIIVNGANGTKAECKVTVKVPLTSIALNKKKADMKKGDSLKLNVSYNPEDTTENKTVYWQSSNLDILTVDQNGNVKAVGSGTATISAYCKDNTLKDTCEITVTNPMTDLYLSDSEITVNKGDFHSLTAACIPTDTTDPTDMEWTSLDKSVATVTSYGLIEAVGAGTTTIKVSCNGFVKTCKVTVKVPLYSINMDSSATLNKGDKTKLEVRFNPEDTTESKKLAWKSSDPSIAKVASDGTITAVKPGMVTIKASTENGLTAMCELNVVSPLTNIQFEKDQITVNKNKPTKLKVLFNPEDTTDAKDLTFTSNNKSIVDVDQEGSITGLRPGTAVITARSLNGLTAKCTVTVKAPLEGIELNYFWTSIGVNKSVDLKVSYNPSDAEDVPEAVWSSSKPEVAIVNKDGKVTGLKPGSTVITVKVGDYEASCSIDVVKTIINLESISLDQTSMNLYKGDSGKLNVKFNPTNATVSTGVKWSSSDPSVVFVDKNGNLTALKKGTAVITAKVGDKTATCTVKVSEKEIALDSITLDRKDLDVNIGEEKELHVSYNPSNTTVNKTVAWSSSNEKVATVDENGNVKAVGEGTAIITATVDGKTATCTIKVTALSIPLQSIVLNHSSLAMETGKSSQLEVYYNPSNTTVDKTVIWTSSNEKIATVSEDGTVTAKASGTAIITAKVGDKTVSCTIMVKETEVTVNSITLDRTELEIESGNTASLHATVKQTDGPIINITWSSSNSSVVSVDEDGNLKALKEGTAIIIAKAGDKTASCVVTVSKKEIALDSIALDQKELNATIGTEHKLHVSYNPSNTTVDKTVIWSSTNEKIATVDKNGNVKAVGEGTAIITAKVGDKTASCTITVTEDIKEPGSGNTDQEPGSGNTDQEPGSGNTDQKPDTGNTDQKPDTGNTDQKPDTGNTDQKPGTGNADQKPSDNNNQGTTDKVSSENDKTSSIQQENNATPKTGDPAMMEMWAALVAISGGVIAKFKKKRK